MHETQSFWEKKTQAQDSPLETTNILPKRQGIWGSKRSILFLLDNVANHICSGNK